MLSRPLITIWRYTSAELWRLVVLTASILVMVIGFALTVKFFAEGALGPLQMLTFMAMAAVPMLQYALPFAGGFSATLVYHRLAQDNELTGARAAGISHSALLVPACVTGIILAVTLSLLTEFVIPRFLLSMEGLVSESAAKIITHSIRHRKAIEAGNLRIYADDVQPQPGDPSELVLSGVIVERVDGDAKVLSSLIAAKAQVSLSRARELGENEHSGRGATIVRLRLHNASVYGGQSVFVQTSLIEYAVAIPTRFDDDPKFLTLGQLRRAYENPDLLSPVNDRRINLARNIALREIEVLASRALREKNSLEFRVPDGPRYVVHAGDMVWNGSGRQGWRFIPIEGEDVEIERIGEDGTIRLRARLAILSTPWNQRGQIVEIGRLTSDQRLEFDLGLDDVRTVTDSGEIGQRDRHQIRRLRVSGDPTPGLLELSSAQLLEKSEPYIDRSRPDEFILGPAGDLSRRIERIRREIVGKQHERVAMSAACMVMMLAGAVTAIRLGQAPPLVVYLWSFFPSLLTVLTISAGQPMVENSGAIGFVMLWGGVVVFAGYTLGAFVLLRSR
ncbi:MAG: LptF/LptG family permease [Planctomycetes bacterium]|nr:LptF/LptG family permease [Planctomycetota bacterium]